MTHADKFFVESVNRWRLESAEDKRLLIAIQALKDIRDGKDAPCHIVKEALKVIE